MPGIELTERVVVYENPQPTLRSRHGYFPGAVKVAEGELLCLFVLGEAFESVDQTTYATRSTDGGKSWCLEGPIYDKSRVGTPVSDSMKPTVLADGRIIAVGYRFDRGNPGGELVNPDTGGVRGGDVIVAFSQDKGRSWTPPEPVALSHPGLLEVSGPAIQSHSGDLLAGGPPMPAWDGSATQDAGGVLLRSRDGGRTWDDSGRYFQWPGSQVSPLETRFAQMPDGRVAAIVWALDNDSGKSLPNQITISKDDGRSWSAPIDTGIAAQASNILPWRNDILLSIHAHRQGEDPGLYVRALELGGNGVRVLAESKIWGNAVSRRIGSFAEMSTSLRFGQPSLVALGDGDVMAVFWAVEDGQGRIVGLRLNMNI